MPKSSYSRLLFELVREQGFRGIILQALGSGMNPKVSAGGRGVVVSTGNFKIGHDLTTRSVPVLGHARTANAPSPLVYETVILIGPFMGLVVCHRDAEVTEVG
jgi:hypothetical protein